MRWQAKWARNGATGKIAGVFRQNLLIIQPHPTDPMKKLLFIPILGLALFASSCRTVTPLDPMTMKQSERCLPAGTSSGQVYGTK
jgi:hypothetical protein